MPALVVPRPSRRRRSRRQVAAWTTAVVISVAGLATVAPSSASASDSPVGGDAAGARALAAAMSSQAGLVTGASWDAVPPDGVRAGEVSDTPLTSFPVADRTYALLTTGDAATAGAFQRRSAFDTLVNGGGARGDDAFDISVLKVDVAVPVGDNCLGFDFRFLSDEFPEQSGSGHDDAFVAELDSSTWTTRGSVIDAPGNFAADPDGRPIGAGATGVAALSVRNSAGTTYDGGTPHLNARTAVSAGAHSVYLSIFDQGDHTHDSTVLLDNLHTFVDRSCGTGVERANESDAQTVAAGAALTTDGRGNGATATDPIETTVVGRDTGLVRIEESTNLQKDSAPWGFSMLDLQSTVASLAVPDAWVAVTAPAGLMAVSSRGATSAGGGRPTAVRLVVDSTTLPAGLSPNDLVLLRNGVAVRRCLRSTASAAPAAPRTGTEPCRTVSRAPDGDLVVEVSVTAPSTFTFAVPSGAATATTCDGMPATIIATHGAITGTPGDDVIVGTHGHDTIEAGDGDDTVCARDGNDTVLGGAGDDLIEAEAGHDHAQGGPGDDEVAGNDGSDRLLGDDGRDLVLGGEGHDKLLGGAGVDRCDGGPGTDHPTDCESITGVP